MKLQIAFNSADLDQDLAIAQQVCSLADYIEIGPLLLNKYGLVAIEKFREILPQSRLIADTHIIEFGADSTKINLEAGADWVTVLAGASSGVIHTACTTAHNLGKKVFLDLIDARSRGQSALEAKSYGIDAIIFHQPYDSYEESTLIDEWEMVKGNTDLPVYISAPINRNTLQSILNLAPHGLSIGKAITQATDPVAEAQYFKQMLST